MTQTMRALLLKNDGYSRTPSGSVLEAMDPYVEYGTIDVPSPGPSQVLVKVSLASVNPSDVMFLKGLYGQPRKQGQPAGFEGVGEVVATGDSDLAKGLAGKRIAFATGLSNWGAWAEYAVAEAAACIPLIDTVGDEDGAAMIVNPLTALAMFGIVKDEGQKSFILTAGASQLCKLIAGVVQRGAGVHAQFTVDIAGFHRTARFQPLIQGCQNLDRARLRVFGSIDRKLISPSEDLHAKRLFDLCQVAVEFTA